MTHLGTYVALLHRSEQALAGSLRVVGAGHAAEADVFHTCHLLASWSDAHVERLLPLADRYPPGEEPERLHVDPVTTTRSTGVGLLRDLQELYLIASLVQSSWTVVWDAAQGRHDRELMTVAEECNSETSRQLAWLTTRLKEAAPQALLVAP